MMNHCMKEIKLKISQNLSNFDINIESKNFNQIGVDRDRETNMQSTANIETKNRNTTHTIKSEEFFFTRKEIDKFHFLLQECTEEEKKKWNSLKDNLMEISSLLAAAIFERMSVQINYSVRALLSLYHDLEHAIDRDEDLSDFLNLIVSTIR